jgi:hypothetical protein
LIPISGSNRDWKATFSPGWWFQPRLILLLVPGPIPTGTKRRKSKVYSLLV